MPNREPTDPLSFRSLADEKVAQLAEERATAPSRMLAAAEAARILAKNEQRVRDVRKASSHELANALRNDARTAAGRLSIAGVTPTMVGLVLNDSLHVDGANSVKVKTEVSSALKSYLYGPQNRSPRTWKKSRVVREIAAWHVMFNSNQTISYDDIHPFSNGGSNRYAQGIALSTAGELLNFSEVDRYLEGVYYDKSVNKNRHEGRMVWIIDGQPRDGDLVDPFKLAEDGSDHRGQVREFQSELLALFKAP